MHNDHARRVISVASADRPRVEIWHTGRLTANGEIEGLAGDGMAMVTMGDHPKCADFGAILGQQ